MNAPDWKTTYAPAEDKVARLREPPWSEEAEQSVLGGLLLDNGAWDRVDGLLTGADFYAHRHRTIYAAITGACAALRPADVVTIAVALRTLGSLDEVGGHDYLNALTMGVPSAANIRRYAEIVRERSVHRALIAATDTAAALAWSSEDTSATLDVITTTFGQLERRHVRQMPRSIDELVGESIDRVNELHENGHPPGWPTHIPQLDDRLFGGLQPGLVHILAARPSVGKSSFAGQIVTNLVLLENLPTLVLSLEMTAREFTDRMLAGVGRLSHKAILTGKLVDDEWGRLSEGGEKLRRCPLCIDDQSGLTLADIRRKAKSIKGLKVLVLDYLQLCGGGRRDGNRNLEIEEISRGLKVLAKELGIAVLALSQLNREGDKRANKRPQLSDLRDSGAIEQDADVVLLLWPVRDFMKTEGRKIVGLEVAKARNGRPGEFGLDFHADHHRWGESSADISPPAPPPIAKGETYR